MTRTKSSSAREKAKRAQLSCFTCRARKVKCDRLLPCAACAQYQDPEGCRYDMSDDKRQPILMADANKQLRRENLELRSRNQEKLCENEMLKVENHGIKALATELRARLAAVEHEPFGDTNQTLIQNSFSHTNRPASPPLDSKLLFAHTQWIQHDVVTREDQSMLPGAAEKSNVSQTVVSTQGFPRSHQSHQPTIISQTLSRARLIMSRCQTLVDAGFQVLTRSIEELKTLLALLPDDLRFSNPWFEDARSVSLKPVHIHAVLLYRTIHSYLMVLLDRVNHPHNVEFSDHQTSLLIEASKAQLVTACLNVLATSEYFLIHGHELAFSDADFWHQTFNAVDILTRVNASRYILPIQQYIRQLISRLHNIQSQYNHVLAGHVLTALYQLLSTTTNQNIPQNRPVQISLLTPDDTVDTPHPSSCHSNNQSEQQNNVSNRTNIKIEPRSDCSNAIIVNPSFQSAPGLQASAFDGYEGDRTASYPGDWQTFNHMGASVDFDLQFNLQHAKNLVTTSCVSMNGPSTFRSAKETTRPAMEASSCQLSCSTASISDESYSSSLHTSSPSSRYSSRGSHPVSPVHCQERDSVFELQPASHEYIHYGQGNGDQFWSGYS